MTGRGSALPFCLALVAGALAAPAAAPAQCRLCDTPTTASDNSAAGNPISLQIDAALDFDRLVLFGAGEGTAALLPDGSRQVSGMIQALSSRAMVGSAMVRGEPGRSVRIDLPQRIELYSVSGGRIVIDRIVSDLPVDARLDGAGLISFRFGGRLHVTGDAEGDYRGEIPITAEYL